MKITLNGIPCAQKRMRSSNRGGFSRIYDPNHQDKKRIKEEIRKQSDLELFDHPRICFLFIMPIPKSLPKKKIVKYELGFIKHEKKPDVDNLIKLYLDCLDGILFEGDQKVTLGQCIKLYGLEPKTIILIQEKTELVSRQELDELIHVEVFGEPTPLTIECPP